MKPLPHKRSGQAVVFLLLAFTALVFVLLLNVDLHRIIQRKDQTQNAGDAAALAAARWEGSTLNLVGELNLLHAIALTAQERAAVDAITNMQARLCFTGPMAGLFAAQVAAKQNHIYVDQEMTALLMEHAATVRSQYGAGVDGELAYPEPWPGGWAEYADMIQQVASEGIAAGPDNAQFFADPESEHPLLKKAFYDAVLGKNWCWFFLNTPGLLESYSSFHDWPPLPEPDAAAYANSEIFGLGIQPSVIPLRYYFDPETLAELISRAGLRSPSLQLLAASNVMDSFETWYFYDKSKWTEWTLISADSEDPFPAAGPVRPEYDYEGADTVLRVYATVDRMTPNIEGGNQSDKVVWTAAAKPFGYLEAPSEKTRPDAAANFVLPAFRNVRLIPVDAASGADNSTSDVEWIRHIRSHLPVYVNTGPQPASCRYCVALGLWEPAAFRKEGVDWLETNSGLCRIPTGGGGHGGSRRRGH